MAGELGATKLVLGTACANLAKVLKSPGKNLSSSGPLVEEIKVRMELFLEVNVT